MTLLNIFRNYIPNKIVKCSYRDPPWIAKQIRPKVKKKASKITKKYYRKGEDPTIFVKTRRMSRVCNDF